MSINSELLARLERLGPVRVVHHVPLSSDEAETVCLRRTGPLDKPIWVARRLADAGAGLKGGHNAINDLASIGRTTCVLRKTTDFVSLTRDLRGWNVDVFRRRVVDDPAAFITAARERRGLSQREFADRLGFDVRTLQNWEQGRNRPESAVLSLVTLFEQDAAAVERAVFAPVEINMDKQVETVAK